MAMCMCTYYLLEHSMAFYDGVDGPRKFTPVRFMGTSNRPPRAGPIARAAATDSPQASRAPGWWRGFGGAGLVARERIIHAVERIRTTEILPRHHIIC